MINELTKKHEILYNKISNLLNNDEVEKTNEVISAYDLKNIICNQMSKYDAFINNLDNTLKQMNKNNKNVKRYCRLPIAYKIINYIDKDNKSYIRIYFDKNRSKGKCTFILDSNNSVSILESDYPYESTRNFIINNNRLLLNNFSILNDLKDNYPNEEFVLSNDKLDNYKLNFNQVIDDGFVTFKLRPFDSNNIVASLSKMDDLVLSTVPTENHIELIDYIGMYNDEILKKTLVRIDILNPLFKKICMKENEELKEKDYISFTLTKK